MKKTRIGIIGVGPFCTNYHLRHLQARPDVEVAAVCDVNPDRLSKPDLAPIPSFENSDLIDPDRVDGIIISTPNSHHFDTCRLALERRIPVLVDKPTTVTTTDATQLVSLSKSQDCLLMTAFTRRFMASTEHVRSRIQDGQLTVRKITAVQARIGQVKSSADGGILHRRTVHIFDVIPWLLDDPVLRVDASIEYVPGSDQESIVDAHLHSQSGRTIDLLVIRDSDDFLDEVTVYGDERCYRLDKQVVYQSSPKSGWQRLADLPAYGTSTDHFIDAIRGETVSPDAPYHDLHSQDGLQALRILEAIHRSARSGGFVDVTPD